MKKIVTVSVLMFLTISFLGCKSDKVKEVKVEKKDTPLYSVANAKNDIKFTAYKTTDKVPVGGQFKKVNIISDGEGNSVKEAINNTEFSIPVSSIFTKDVGRDSKIKNFFFGVMEKTELLTGKLVLENDSIGYTNLKMNGITQKVAFSYTINKKTFSMSTKIDVSKWNALKALNSLNTVCKELHKGADGVSKTWSEVALNITSVF